MDWFYLYSYDFVYLWSTLNCLVYKCCFINIFALACTNDQELKGVMQHWGGKKKMNKNSMLIVQLYVVRWKFVFRPIFFLGGVQNNNMVREIEYCLCCCGETKLLLQNRKNILCWSSSMGIHDNFWERKGINTKKWKLKKKNWRQNFYLMGLV